MKPSLKKKFIEKHIIYLLFPFLLFFFCYYIWRYKEYFWHPCMNNLQKFIGDKLQGLRIHLSKKKKKRIHLSPKKKIHLSLTHPCTQSVCICVSLCQIFPNFYVHVYMCMSVYLQYYIWVCVSIYMYTYILVWVIEVLS